VDQRSDSTGVGAASSTAEEDKPAKFTATSELVLVPVVVYDKSVPFYNNNNVPVGIRNAVGDSSAYYMLAYYRSGKRKPGMDAVERKGARLGTAGAQSQRILCGTGWRETGERRVAERDEFAMGLHGYTGHCEVARRTRKDRTEQENAI
jgi:hypothetical protein